MEGQYDKDDVLSFDLYKLCPQLKGQFAMYCKVLEIRLRSLVSTYRVIPFSSLQNWMSPTLFRSGEPAVKTHLKMIWKYNSSSITNAVPQPPSRVAEDRIFAANTSGIAKLQELPAPSNPSVVGLLCRMVGTPAAG